MKHLLALVLTLMSLSVCAQSYKISGVIAGSDGNSIPFVSVSEKGTTNGTISDSDGNFIIKVKQLPATLYFSCLGFVPVEYQVTSENSKINIKLEEETTELSEVQVTAKHGRSRTDNVIIGVENIQMSEMAKVPALMGERDVIKSIQLLPGIKSEGDGSCGFQVRGGTAAQNLILIDNAPIYNAGHLMGVFSTFNDEALTNASLYKGAIPAQFGDASSSIFDIKTRHGNMENFGMTASIGLLSSKIAIDGPIWRDRASFFVAARRTYFELFLKPTEKYRNKVLNFYDLNSSISIKTSKNGTLNLMSFSGRDNMEMDNNIAEIHWGNQASAVEYRHNFGNSFTSKTSLAYSNYDFIESMNVLKIKESFDGYLQHQIGKEEISYSLSEYQKINFGAQFDRIKLKSGEIKESNGLVEKELRRGEEISFWIGEDIKTNFGLEVSAGARGVIFNALGGDPYYNLNADGLISDTLYYGKGEPVKRYFGIEPRISAKYQITDHQSIKAGYCRTTQHVQNILNNGMSSPIGRSVMSSNIIKPQTADQVSVGYMAETKNKNYEFSIEGYYKTIENVYDYKDGKNLVSAIEMESLLLNGKGRAYGVELYAKKNLGDFTGWVSYTLSWADNKIDGINNNEWYTAPNDRRHDVSIVAMYKLNHKWDISATWVFTSGQALTAPSAKYTLDENTHYYFQERSGYRAPAYHRLDAGINNTKERPRYTRIWSFGVYNLYNHYNPYLITFENDDEKATGTKTVQTSLFGIIPSVTYTIKF